MSGELTFMIFLISWFGSSAVVAAWSIYVNWRDGRDLHVNELGRLLLIVMMGWVTVLGWVLVTLYDWMITARQGVVLRGSKSARAYKALTKTD